jgi:hypothetical protein
LFARNICIRTAAVKLMEERWTLIWIKRSARWLMVREHSSAPPGDIPQ